MANQVARVGQVIVTTISEPCRKKDRGVPCEECWKLPAPEKIKILREDKNLSGNIALMELKDMKDTCFIYFYEFTKLVQDVGGYGLIVSGLYRANVLFGPNITPFNVTANTYNILKEHYNVVLTKVASAYLLLHKTDSSSSGPIFIPAVEYSKNQLPDTKM